jgi:GTPase SAR1 family protein
MSTQRFKIVLLGEGRVGKTSILLRYTRGIIITCVIIIIDVIIIIQVNIMIDKYQPYKHRI